MADGLAVLGWSVLGWATMAHETRRSQGQLCCGDQSRTGLCSWLAGWLVAGGLSRLGSNFGTRDSCSCIAGWGGLRGEGGVVCDVSFLEISGRRLGLQQ